MIKQNSILVLEKSFGIFTLVAFGLLVIVYPLSGGGAISSWYTLLLFILAVAAYALVAPAIIRLLGDQKIAKSLRIAIAIAGLMAFSIFVPVLVGALQDSFGHHCAGIMGAESTCVESQTLWPLLFYLSTFHGALIILATICTLALAGWIQHWMGRR